MSNLPELRTSAARQLLDVLSDPDRVNRYLELWDSAAATAGGGSRFPCPACFAKGLISPMQLTRSNSGTVDSLMCPRCGTILKAGAD